MRRHPSRRRSEGATEYVAITCLVSACVIVGMFRFGGEIQETMERAEICINCETDAETEGNGNDPTNPNEGGDGTAGTDTNTGPLPWYNDPRYSWLADFIRFFGGAPHFMDLVFPRTA